MAKSKTAYVCSQCGGLSNKWAGQCPDCNAWNTLSETIISKSATSSNPSSRNIGYAGDEPLVCDLQDITLEELPRIHSGLSELDRVLGGGLVPGAVVLIGGDPGIGKSTLLLQSLCHISTAHSVLYVTGEESLQQVKLRATRLGLQDHHLRLLAETQSEKVLTHLQQEHAKVVVIDSIQTIYTELLQSAPGSVAQVRESAAQLVRYAKQTHTSLWLVGHVTKDGALAGPRVLEHMVDAVLYFEGEQDSRYRVVRAVKNRFGAVNELGVFAMTDRGLREVTNPSAIFLSHYEQPIAGSVIMTVWEGTRPLLVEVQALVDDSHLNNPRRTSVGYDAHRLSLLLAALHRHCQIATYNQDVFLNVVGGIEISETSADLAVVLAIVSSLRNRPIPHEWIVFGEVGLGGEIRPVPNGQERLREAAKHGFKRAIVPYANAPKQAIDQLQITAVRHLQEAVDAIL